MAYIGKSPTGSGVRQRYVYTATGGETSLSGADDNSKTLKFTDGEYVDVHLNGVLLVQGTDYGVGTANTISSLAALAANDVVEITVYDVYNVAKINSEAMRNRWYFTATGGETSITTTEVAGLKFNANAEIEVRLNGVSLQQGVDFNTTTANQVGGLAALTAGQVVEIIHYADFQLADTVSKAAGGTYTGQVIADGGIDLNGKELILDADADSKIEAGTDDTINIISGGTTGLTIDSSGRVLQPARPMWMAKGNSGSYITTDPIPFPTADVNVGSIYDTSTYEVTIPVDGVYAINVNVLVRSQNNENGYPRIQLKPSGGSYENKAYAYVYNNGLGTALEVPAIINVLMDLNAGDKLRVKFTASGGDYYNGGDECSFSGYLLG